MLDRAGSAKGRAELSAQTGIGGALILKWANHVDLMRISGVGPQYAELLEAAGVDGGGQRSEEAGGDFAGGFSGLGLDRAGEKVGA